MQIALKFLEPSDCILAKEGSEILSTSRIFAVLWCNVFEWSQFVLQDCHSRGHFCRELQFLLILGRQDYCEVKFCQLLEYLLCYGVMYFNDHSLSFKTITAGATFAENYNFFWYWADSYLLRKCSVTFKHPTKQHSADLHAEFFQKHFTCNNFELQVLLPKKFSMKTWQLRNSYNVYWPRDV